MGFCPGGRIESDITEWLTLHTWAVQLKWFGADCVGLNEAS